MRLKLFAAVVTAAVLGCVAWAEYVTAKPPAGVSVSPGARCCEDPAPAVERGVVYGNDGRWEWHYGYWWWVMKYDSRYLDGGDIRRRCGNTAEHWVRKDAFKSSQLQGHCRNLPGYPGWYKVLLVGNDLLTAASPTPDAKVVAFELVEELKEPRAPDTTTPGPSK